MMEPHLRPECNTPGCHAGWAALVLRKKPTDANYNYEEAAGELSRFLGLDGTNYGDALEHWAELNPDIWGNSRGRGMFCEAVAFDQPHVSFPVQVLIDHWRGVGERLREREALSGS